HHLHLLYLTRTATPEVHTLPLHDALPIFAGELGVHLEVDQGFAPVDDDRIVRSERRVLEHDRLDLARVHVHAPNDEHVVDAAREIGRARLNSSHVAISYAVFCLKKKKKTK